MCCKSLTVYMNMERQLHKNGHLTIPRPHQSQGEEGLETLINCVHNLNMWLSWISHNCTCKCKRKMEAHEGLDQDRHWPNPNPSWGQSWHNYVKSEFWPSQNFLPMPTNWTKDTKPLFPPVDGVGWNKTNPTATLIHPFPMVLRTPKMWKL